MSDKQQEHPRVSGDLGLKIILGREYEVEEAC
jgi:hypothetical protein